MPLRRSLVLVVALTTVFALSVQQAGAAPHSRPNCRKLVSLVAIREATGKTLEFAEWGKDTFNIAKPVPGTERVEACVFDEPARSEYTVDPYGGFLKAGFAETEAAWNSYRNYYKGGTALRLHFKPTKIAGTKSAFYGLAAKPEEPQAEFPSEDGELSMIVGWLKNGCIFEFGLNGVPLRQEQALIPELIGNLNKEWLARGRS